MFIFRIGINSGIIYLDQWCYILILLFGVCESSSVGEVELMDLDRVNE